MIPLLLSATLFGSQVTAPLRSLKQSEQPIRTIELSKIEAAQSAAALPLEIAGMTLHLSMSWGKDYLQYLSIRIKDRTDFYTWDELKAGIRDSGVDLTLKGKVIAACPPEGACTDVPVQALLERAYGALPLHIPQVKYGLAVSADGAYFGMLRRTEDGQFYVGVHSLEKMARETVWFVAVNGTMYGVRHHDAMVTFVKKDLQ